LSTLIAGEVFSWYTLMSIGYISLGLFMLEEYFFLNKTV
jgi:hypothetical protein